MKAPFKNLNKGIFFVFAWSLQMADFCSANSFDLDTTNQFDAPHERADHNAIGMVVNPNGRPMNVAVMKTGEGIRYFVPGSFREKKAKKATGQDYLIPLDSPGNTQIHFGDPELGTSIDEGILDPYKIPESFLKFVKRGEYDIGFQLNVKAGSEDVSVFQSNINDLSPRMADFARYACGIHRVPSNCMELPDITTLVSRDKRVSFAFVVPRDKGDISKDEDDNAKRDRWSSSFNVSKFDPAEIFDYGVSDHTLNIVSYKITFTIADNDVAKRNTYTTGVISMPWSVTEAMLMQCPYVIEASDYVRIVEENLPSKIGPNIKRFGAEARRVTKAIELSLAKYIKNSQGRHGRDCIVEQ